MAVAMLIALAGPIPAAALVPGANGLIAFVSSRDHTDSGTDIYVMNADGTNPTRLTTDGGDQPVISPDGRHIAYRCPRGGNFEICLMNADGTSPTNLTNNPAADAEPTFSPDGTHIAFSSQGRDSPFSGSDIFVMNADGTNQTHLTINRTGAHPVYSPDGHYIAFECTRNNLEICLMNADGTNPTNLTNNPAYDAQPFWGTLAAAQTATTTTLTVFPDFAFQGLPIALVARVAPPHAAGTIQIMDGTTLLGAPAPVFAGFAVLITTLPAGTHTLTAVFTPSTPGTIAPSTSAPVSLAVRRFL